MRKKVLENCLHPASQLNLRLLCNPPFSHLKSTQHVAYDRNADAVGARFAILRSAAGVEQQAYP
jgi:hypothetical protein